MKIHYDSQLDTLTVTFGDAAVASRIPAEGAALTYDAQGRLAGVKVHHAAQHAGDPAAFRELTLAVERFAAMPIALTTHLRLDDQGRPWIDDTNVKVIEVVLDKVGGGMSPEQIHEAYPDLSLGQIHAALSYYYDHKELFDAEIERQRREYEAARAAQRDSPLHQKLRAAGKLP